MKKDLSRTEIVRNAALFIFIISLACLIFDTIARKEFNVKDLMYCIVMGLSFIIALIAQLKRTSGAKANNNISDGQD